MSGRARALPRLFGAKQRNHFLHRPAKPVDNGGNACRQYSLTPMLPMYVKRADESINGEARGYIFAERADRSSYVEPFGRHQAASCAAIIFASILTSLKYVSPRPSFLLLLHDTIASSSEISKVPKIKAAVFSLLVLTSSERLLYINIQIHREPYHMYQLRRICVFCGFLSVSYNKSSFYVSSFWPIGSSSSRLQISNIKAHIKKHLSREMPYENIHLVGLKAIN